jgi:hypothetical protein
LFISYYNAVNTSQPFAHMVNKASTVMAPTTVMAQYGMANFITELAENNFALNIFDQGQVLSTIFLGYLMHWLSQVERYCHNMELLVAQNHEQEQQAIYTCSTLC